MSKFKIGDRVKCIDNDNDSRGHLKLEYIYVVSKVDSNNDIVIEGSVIFWFGERFELVNSVNMEEFQIW